MVKVSAAQIALVGVLLLAAGLHFFRLDQEGYNLYYAATVKSMLSGWHTFFFASFDPGGFVTVDKPPLGLWVQAASARLLGFSGFSLLLPQALAGVLSVALLYRLVARSFGATAGLLAALTLAISPISIAANRNNTMDGLLVLVLLLAAWAVSLAAETGRLRWLLLGAALVGLGFNIKMLQAFMVLPAFYLLYLAVTRLPWWKRLVHLALASLVLLVISLAWVVAVDTTPPQQRPYVGSSRNNTVTELILGHNALERLGGMADWLGLRRFLGPPPGPPPGQPPPGDQPAGPYPVTPPPVSPPQAGQPGPAGQPPTQPGNEETGQPGLLRLFNRQLGGQASWLLPLAGLGLLVATWQTRLRWPLSRPHGDLLLWGAWLAPQVVFFSFAGLFHRYYLEMLSPAIAALVGAGVVALWKDYGRDGWRGWLLPLALVGSAAVEARILADFPEWASWLTPIIVAPILLSTGLLVLCRVRPLAICYLRPAAYAVGVLALLIAPTVWAMTPVAGGDAGLPFAGPELLARPQRPGPAIADRRLTDYLLANRQGQRFLVATLNANTAAPIILATGQPVMALGGFSGGDPILSVQQLAERVRKNDVRFFLLPTQAGQQADLIRWVSGNCRPVPPNLWQAGPPGRGQVPNPGPEGTLQLYDCAR